MGKKVSLRIQGRVLTFRNARCAQEYMAGLAREQSRLTTGKTLTDFEPCAAEGFSRQGEHFTRKTAPTQRNVKLRQVHATPRNDARPLGYVPVKGCENQTRIDKVKGITH